MDKEDVVCIYMEDYSPIKKKKKILPFVVKWMELEGIMLSEIGHTEKEKHYKISPICGI